MNALVPLLLQPNLQPRLWGGRRLASHVGKALPTDEPYGESWELHPTVRVADGPFSRQTIGELAAQFGHDLIGRHTLLAESLPLVVKFLDAAEWLSLQVHPNDAQAQHLEGKPRGQHESWYVIDAKPGARLIAGVRPGVTKKVLVDAIRENSVQALLSYVDVTAGDLIDIPPGTIHALGPDILVYEIQQASDTTYRLSDWGRIGTDGKPRELHLDKGLSVTNFDLQAQVTHPIGNNRTVQIVHSPFYTVILHTLDPSDGVLSNTYGEEFHVLTLLKGEAILKSSDSQLAMLGGQTCFIPASVGQYGVTGYGNLLAASESRMPISTL